jgi:hypothetical protein
MVAIQENLKTLHERITTHERREVAFGRRIVELEALLRELIDIEGPLPGNVMWFRRVQQTLGVGPFDCIHPGFDELGVCTCCKEFVTTPSGEVQP